MRAIAAGVFYVGSLGPSYENEENPRFQLKLEGFCALRNEVSTADYEKCVAEGKCTPPHGSDNKTCNRADKGKAEHPINCVDFYQADAYCKAHGSRLPTEVEWEYMARGGTEMRKFPWGSESPDDRTCWKHHETCRAASFQPGAFDLHDVVGNVWEWTSSWFGPYPWPALDGKARVIRGGGWSRRFDKWLSPTLRNRLAPDKWGSHLGFRCVRDMGVPTCSAGRASDGSCVREILSVDCRVGTFWNGATCAKAATPSLSCPLGTQFKAGYGCVREAVAGSGAAQSLDLSAVIRARSSEFDEDCQKNQPKRPRAYRYSEGEHLARNARVKADGCKNRDVGVGWNSACCPE